MASQKVGPLEVGIAIVVVIIGSITMMGSGSSSPKVEDESSMAAIQCENFIKDRLKAPATADFPFLADKITKVSDRGYRVESHVDAQNAFGAKLRANYTCELEWNGQKHSDRKNWALTNLHVE